MQLRARAASSKPIVLSWLLLLTGVALAADPLSPEEALKSFQLADPALRVELVAAEPLVASPCAIAWDEKGRLFVAENRGYPSTAQPPQGVIAMLEDTDGDGRMDKRTVFADGLTYPNGVLPWRGGLIVTCAPDVIYLKDTDGGGRADVRQVLLTGFDTKGSTQLRVNAPTLGPDGWVYLAAGLSGGTITAPSHPERPALKMTGDVRFHPETLVVENVDGRSQYGQSFDDYGRRFICMNRLPVQHVVLPSRWLRRNPHFPFSETVQDCNERSVKSGLRGGNDGVRLFPISSNITTADSHAGSFTAACGVHLWTGGALPETYRGLAFSCDPTGNLVHADRLVPQGATFVAESKFAGKEFLASRDDWFRPVFLADGPDGALYVADMYRKVIEHPDYLPEEIRKRTDFESGKDRGRIWRVCPADRKSPAAPMSANATPAELVAQLLAHDGWQRATAARLLLEQDGEGTHRALRQAADDEKRVARDWRALLPQLVRCKMIMPRDLQRAWEAGDAALRALIVRAWLESPAAREWQPDPAVLAHDPDAEVRTWAALAFGEMAEGGPALGEIAALNPDDRWLRAASLSSAVGREPEFQRELMGHTKTLSEGVLQMLEVSSRSYESMAKLSTEVGADSSAPNPIEGSDLAFTAARWLGLCERTSKTLKADSEGLPLADFLGQISRVAADEHGSPVVRELCFRLLARCEWPVAQPPLTAAIDSSATPELRFAAIRALAQFPQPEVARCLLAPGKWARATPAERETILSALLSNTSQLSGILDAIDAGALPTAAVPTVRRAAFLKAKDPALRSRAEKLWSAPAGDRQQAYQSAKAALALKADPKHGKDVFKSICATCHRLDREGYAVGPDLLDIRNQPKESILFHIVIPEAEVNVTYAPYLAETKDGNSFAGILTSENPASITLRMPLGVEKQIARGDLAKLEALPGSLMPGGLEQAMSRQDLADLLGYLKGE